MWSVCGTGTYVTADFVTSNIRTVQVWVDPSGPEDPGTRLTWNPDNSGSCNLAPGEFAYTDARDLYVRLSDGSDPSGHDVHMTCQGGDCAARPIQTNANAEYMAVRSGQDRTIGPLIIIS